MRLIRYLAAAILVTGSVAWAQSPNSEQLLRQGPTGLSQRVPGPIQNHRFGSECDIDVAGLTHLDWWGSKTELTYNVTGEGRVADVNNLAANVYDPDLDASIECMNDWHTNQSDRSPAESFGPHRATISWHREAQKMIGVFQPSSADCTGYYPPIAIRLGQEGNTTVVFDVSRNGLIQHANVLRSSGHTTLDVPAVACVKFKYPQYAPSTTGHELAISYLTIVWKLPEDWCFAGHNPPISLLEHHCRRDR